VNVNIIDRSVDARIVCSIDNPAFVLSLCTERNLKCFQHHHTADFSIDLLRQYFPNTISVIVSIEIFTVSVTFNRFRLPKTLA
jgi:hypothetical protein